MGGEWWRENGDNCIWTIKKEKPRIFNVSLKFEMDNQEQLVPTTLGLKHVELAKQLETR